MFSGWQKKMNLPALAVLILFFSGCVEDRTAAPLAKKGVIDLSTNDALLIDPVSLDGEWEFYWQQLLTPQDFKGTHPPAMSGYMSFPGSWNRFRLDGQSLGRGGFATFRLQIHPPDGFRGELALRLRYLVASYRIWADGHMLAEGGVVGTDTSSEIPNQHVHFPEFPVADRPIELVLQISNFHWAQGGPLTSIELGTREKLLTKQWVKWGISLLSVGAMLVMGIYHLVLFCFRPKNVAPLYFGFFCLLWMILQLTCNLSDWAVNLLLGDIPIWFQNRFDLIIFLISVPMVYTFFRTLYPEEFSHRLQQLTWLMSTIFIILGLILSTMTFSSAIAVFFIYSIFLILYTVIRIFKVFLKRRQEVLFILLGWISMALTSINDLLMDIQVIQSVYMTDIGMLLFIVFQSFALSLLYSRSFFAVEQLSDELADKNIALEQEMAETTRLEREVVNVTEAERRRMSQDLHDGLCQMLTSAKLHLSALRRKMTGTGTPMPELGELSSLLEGSVNQAYDLSRGLWPVEHTSNGKNPPLAELIRHLSELNGITIEFQQQRGCPECSNTGMTQLFRIAQEAVTNAIKHAQPGKISVGLDCTDQASVCLTVCDNGIGIKNSAKTIGGLGRKIMAYRAGIINGTLTVTDGKDGGTLVTCTAPCEALSTEGSQP
jgi:signal transduction histidine kinase